MRTGSYQVPRGFALQPEIRGRSLKGVKKVTHSRHQGGRMEGRKRDGKGSVGHRSPAAGRLWLVMGKVGVQEGGGEPGAGLLR